MPDRTLVAAVGDLHGCLKELRALLGSIVASAEAAAAERRVLVYLGDYVDRGPDSAGVVAYVAAGPPSGFAAVYLLGNHEELMRDFLAGGPAWPWLMNGGDATCRSYGVEPGPASREGERDAALRDALSARIPPPHRAFLDGLVPSYGAGDYLFVHAGVRPGVPLAAQRPKDLLWIRDAFLSSDEDFGCVVVHGHTPTPEPEERPNRIGIDTGACYGGNLTALLLMGDRRRFLQA